MRKTNKYYRDNLRASISSASSVVAEVINKYFKGEYRNYVRVESDNEFWNCRIEGLGIASNGKVYVDIYWQGDSTDGNNTIWLSELINRSEVVISSTDRHSTLRIEREWLTSVFKNLADLIEPKAIKERELAEKKTKAVGSITREMHNYFYNNYGGGFFANKDKYYNGWASVGKFVDANWESLMEIEPKERLAKAEIVFKNNYKYDGAFEKDEKGHRIYNLSV